MQPDFYQLIVSSTSPAGHYPGTRAAGSLVVSPEHTDRKYASIGTYGCMTHGALAAGEPTKPLLLSQDSPQHRVGSSGLEEGEASVRPRRAFQRLMARTQSVLVTGL